MSSAKRTLQPIQRSTRSTYSHTMRPAAPRRQPPPTAAQNRQASRSLQQRRRKQAILNIFDKDAANDASDDIEPGSTDNVVVNDPNDQVTIEDRVDGLSDCAKQVLTQSDVRAEVKHQKTKRLGQRKSCGKIRATRSKKGNNVSGDKARQHMTTTQNGGDTEHIPSDVKLKPTPVPSTLIVNASVDVVQTATWSRSKKDAGQIEPLPSTSGTDNVKRNPPQKNSHLGVKQKQKQEKPQPTFNSELDPPVVKKQKGRVARLEVLKLQKALESASWTDSKAVEQQEHAIDLETQYDTISPEQNHQVMLRRLELRVPAYRRWQKETNHKTPLALTESKAEMSTNEKAASTKVIKVRLYADQSPEEMEHKDKDEHIRKKESPKAVAMKHGLATTNQVDHDDEVAIECVGANELAEDGMLGDVVAADGRVGDDGRVMMVNSEMAELDGIGEMDEDFQVVDKARFIGTIQHGSALRKSQLKKPQERRVKRKRNSTAGNATAIDSEPVFVVPRRTSHGLPRDREGKPGRTTNAPSIRREDEPESRADIESLWQPQRHGKGKRASRQLELEPAMKIRFDLPGEGVKEVGKEHDGVEEENTQGVVVGVEEGDDDIEETFNAAFGNIGEDNDDDDEDYDAAQDGFLADTDAQKSWKGQSKGKSRDRGNQPDEMQAARAGKSVRAAGSRRRATTGVVVETKIGTRRRTRSGMGK